MNCPECNNSNTWKMHEDRISCTDCESRIVLEYHVCGDCNYTFRTNNGKYIDGSFPMDIEKIVEELLDDINSIAPTYKEASKSSENMSDNLYNCIKCGQALIFDPDIVEYNCPHCGFEWEIIEGE